MGTVLRRARNGGTGMKAYRVYDPHCYEGYESIVFSNNVNEAKKKGYALIDDVEWIDLRVRRLPELDDLQDLTEEELRYVAITRCGFWYNDGYDKIYNEENIDEAIENGFVTHYKTLEETQ